VPELEPDLVVYGVCLNDFLERGARQQASLALLPAKLTKILTRRTRVGRLVDERSAALKRALGLEPDFYADLLADFDARYRRFGADVAAMNALVTGSGLPPMVAMVLDQGPRLNGPGRSLALAAESQLRAAGFEVVDSEGFYPLRRNKFYGKSLGRAPERGSPRELGERFGGSDSAAPRTRALRRGPDDCGWSARVMQRS
jgi:hypothetical protein